MTPLPWFPCLELPCPDPAVLTSRNNPTALVQDLLEILCRPMAFHVMSRTALPPGAL